jgi:hypothetical protein
MKTQLLQQSQKKVNLTLSTDPFVKEELENSAARLGFNKSKFSNALFTSLNEKLNECKDLDEVGLLLSQIEDIKL